MNQSQWLKPYIEFNTQKRIEAEKKIMTDGKALWKLKKLNQYKTSKQRKRLFEMFIGMCIF